MVHEFEKLNQAAAALLIGISGEKFLVKPSECGHSA